MIVAILILVTDNTIGSDAMCEATTYIAMRACAVPNKYYFLIVLIVSHEQITAIIIKQITKPSYQIQ